MTLKKQLGEFAETQACRFLECKGLALLHKNFRCLMGEIDLIMSDQTSIVFVEVRLRSRHEFGNAAASITKNKMQKIIKTATYFLQQRDLLHNISSRFDIITLDATRHGYQIDWIKNAFTASNL